MSNEKKPPPPDDDDDANADRATNMRVYRKRYWQRFRKTRKRVYGTLTADQYAAIEERAEDAGRAVWTQIHAEAEAYARGEYLAPKALEEQITELIIQLRRVGTNVNQITRDFHAKGVHDEPDLLRNLGELEQLIRAFVKKPWGTLPVEPPPDDEPEP